MKELETKKELIIKPKDKRISKCIIYLVIIVFAKYIFHENKMF